MLLCGVFNTSLKANEIELINEVPVTGLTAERGETLSGYFIMLPPNINELKIVISGGSGDADLYVRQGEQPDASHYDCRPYNNGNEETCLLRNIQGGTWYINLVAYTEFSDVSLTAYHEPLCDAPPQANANGPYIGEVAEVIQFSSEGSAGGACTDGNFHWNFGDGEESNEPNPQHTYTSAGEYTATLTVDGWADAYATVTISAPEVLVAETNGPYSADPGESIQFSSEGSNSSNGVITKYEWNFDDGTLSNEANPVHTYNRNGMFTAILTVTSDSGKQASANADIFIGPMCDVPPRAEANGPYSGDAGQAIQFSNEGSYGGGCSDGEFFWTFGDGTTSNEANPTHVYTTAGSYNVTLTVDGYATDTAVATITDSLINACTDQSPKSNAFIKSGRPICVQSRNGGGNYFYFYSPAAASGVIQTQHGNGNLDLYYSDAGWPSTSWHKAASENAGNSERIDLNALSSGWHYIMLSGSHSGATLQVDLQAD